jgi:hypothetical protein
MFNHIKGKIVEPAKAPNRQDQEQRYSPRRMLKQQQRPREQPQE